MKLLIVEDNTLQRELLCELLTSEGFEVVAIENGVRALEKLSEHNFDLIVSDVGMPGMDGYNLAKNVKAKSVKSIPFLIYSSRELDADEMELSAGDVDKYIATAGVQGIKDEVMKFLKDKK